MKEHEFTPTIRKILREEFGANAEDLLKNSALLQYINVKTTSASRGSKARGSFGNIYAIFVLVEDYINRRFHISGNYEDAAGAKFSDLLKRQRELPFGSKLQNHALNHRLNQEFEKYFPFANAQPVLRDPETHQYWINENLLMIDTNKDSYNIAEAILRIINAYIDAKQEAFHEFINDCEKMLHISDEGSDEVNNFVAGLLRPNVDARIFEIVSFAILKANYGDQSIFWGWELEKVEKESLVLYKTGRTNANDGGIDFVMKPLGRFFQVTETLDVTKYFLDIDKVQKYPITFVVKTELKISDVELKIKKQAEAKYPVKTIVQKYMKSIEEIINIPILLERFFEVVELGNVSVVMDEIVKHSRVEFNLLE